MEDLITDETTRMIKDAMRSFARDELWPNAAEIDHSGQIPDTLLEGLNALEVVKPSSMCDVEDYLTPHQYVVVAEELGWGDPAVSLAAFCCGHAALLTARSGIILLPDLLKRVQAGATASFALYEGFGREPSEYRTIATKTSLGWTVKGEKYLVGGSATPEVTIVIARDSDTGEIRALVIDGQPKGLIIERDGAQVATCGLGSAAPISKVRYDGVPAIDLGIDSDKLLQSINLIRLTPAAIAIGAAVKAIEYAADYANERIVFGKPVSSYQGVSFMLVEAQMMVDAARLAIHEVAFAIEGGEDASEIGQLATRACTDAFSAALQTTRSCVQTLGGHGYIRDHPVERLFRAAAGLASLDTDIRHLSSPFNRVA